MTTPSKSSPPPSSLFPLPAFPLPILLLPIAGTTHPFPSRRSSTLAPPHHFGPPLPSPPSDRPTLTPD
ncbi:hypothetical protein E2C01_101248 [Portunus trituberculatus]|uniref:Uncharacterized protein n=1 Tax=Portunus trituberculatus TaxID=210409 RepID=A0A5B7K934_PORTR|nr:hypothetical protein [Portunus trituberculatus]